MTKIIPKSAQQAKDLLLPGLCERYAGRRDWDCYVNEGVVVLRDGTVRHSIVSEAEFDDGWAKRATDRMDRIRPK